MKIAMTLVAALGLGIPAATLTGDKAEVISAHDLQTQLAQLAAPAKATGSSGSTLASYGNLALKLSVRTTSGGGEIHKHYDDLMIVQQGSATLVTGGEIIDLRRTVTVKPEGLESKAENRRLLQWETSSLCPPEFRISC